MKFYRFELSFDDEPQGVGFLQGLSDAIDNEALLEKLMAPFNKGLPIVSIDADDTVVCFFTEAGLKRFSAAIDKIIRTIEPRGWDLLGLVLDEDDLSHALYHDEYQVAWGRTYLEPIPNFYEVHHAKDILGKPQNI